MLFFKMQTFTIFLALIRASSEYRFLSVYTLLSVQIAFKYYQNVCTFCTTNITYFWIYRSYGFISFVFNLMEIYIIFQNANFYNIFSTHSSIFRISFPQCVYASERPNCLQILSKCVHFLHNKYYLFLDLSKLWLHLICLQFNGNIYYFSKCKLLQYF